MSGSKHTQCNLFSLMYSDVRKRTYLAMISCMNTEAYNIFSNFRAIFFQFRFWCRMPLILHNGLTFVPKSFQLWFMFSPKSIFIAQQLKLHTHLAITFGYHPSQLRGCSIGFQYCFPFINRLNCICNSLSLGTFQSEPISSVNIIVFPKTIFQS